MKRACSSGALAAALAVCALSLPGEAQATSKKAYINSFTLIMDYTDRSMMWVEKHHEDAQLAETAAAMAKGNVLTVQDLSPPADFVNIHPHFVSIVESSYKAFEAVADGDMTGFYKIKGKMKKDRQNLNQVMSENNFVFPEII